MYSNWDVLFAAAPNPSHVESILATKCILSEPVLPGQEHNVWHIPRDHTGQPVNCHPEDNLRSDYIQEHRVGPNQVVFAFQTPLPRNGQFLDYSRWMQTLMGVLNLVVAHSSYRPMSECSSGVLRIFQTACVGPEPELDLTMDIRLGYRNRWEPADKWTLLANSTITRKLQCDTSKAQGSFSGDTEKLHLSEAKSSVSISATLCSLQVEDGFNYDCELINLFELGSLHHDFYLINLRLPVAPPGMPSTNEDLGFVEDIWLMAINQNGGFTKVYVAVKTIFLPFVLGVTIWFWSRIMQLPRTPSLLERSLFLLLISLILLTLPLEYLTLFVEIPSMLLLQDLRQGLFNAAIAVFWVVFCGEHRMDEPLKKTFFGYWKVLLPVLLGCLSLLIFDMCERGVQLVNPFFSIWGTPSGVKAAVSLTLSSLRELIV
ncbi:hypothetical protein LAZ67_1001043 [Cordylochernes scorpioides]|uniref:Protein wntless n=1 Tax=Cordylochernes scorpioides TaxID=51811 RepID=A0ABY6JXN3_9ARAC|nr:hypothetical protein LAZ67_1001043 [Cordylochernes scorpioides]